MQRRWMVCALALLAGFSATFALAPNAVLAAIHVNGSRKTKKAKPSRHHQPSRTGRNYHSGNASAPSGPMLLGDQSIEGLTDRNAVGFAEAFPFTALLSGTVTSMSIYVGPHTSASSVVAGLYADDHGRPAARLASATLESPTADHWNTVGLSQTRVTSGRAYWLAVLPKGGSLFLRARRDGACRSASSGQSALTSLPGGWTTGSTRTACPISAYASGTVASRGTGSTPIGGTVAAPGAPGTLSNPVNGTTTPTASSPIDIPPLLPPISLAPPSITGSTVAGHTLATSDGSWLNGPTSYAYQWLDCDTSGNNCADISNATSNSYTLATGDIGHTVRVVVTASNGAGAASSTSSQTGTVAPPPPPSNSGVPVVSGSTVQGQTLSTTSGSWTNSPTSYGYQWQRCGSSCSNISGAEGSTYVLQSADVGDTIDAVVTATNAGGSGSATSQRTGAVTAATTPPSPPSNSTLPVVNGSTVQGQTLSTTSGSWTNSPTSYGYQWQRCGSSCSNISGATGSTYVLQSADVGDTIDAVVTATNAGGSASAASHTVGPVTSSGSGGGANGSCDLSATPSNFASQVAAAQAGQGICLASGSYGTWSGTNKAITIEAASGASPTMSDSFGSGTCCFTLSGIGGLNGTISGTAHDITIENSTFTGGQDVLMDDMENANVVFNADQFPAFVGTARLWAQDYNTSGGGASGSVPSGVVVENSVFNNPNNIQGGADGVRCDGASIQILNNDFSGVDDANNGGNHGDPIQIYGGTHCIIKGNFFHGMVNSAGCSLGQWDGGYDNVFENNVVAGGPSNGCYDGVDLLDDHGSQIIHNVFSYGSCLPNGASSPCGAIMFGGKSSEGAGSGTVVENNILTVFANGDGGLNSSYTEDHNLIRNGGSGTGDIKGTPTYVGGANATTYAGYALASGSPGIGAASDGTNMGIQLPTGG